MEQNKKIDDLVGYSLWIIPSVLFFVLAYFVGFRIGLHWRLLWLLMWVVLVLVVYAMFNSWKKRNKDTNVLKFRLKLYLPIWIVLAYWTFRMMTMGPPVKIGGVHDIFFLTGFLIVWVLLTSFVKRKYEKISRK